MKNASFNEIWDKLKKSKSVAMTLHQGPDGDSLGSCLAMKYVLERDLHCKVNLVSYDSLSGNLNNYKQTSEIKFGTDISDLKLEDYDCVLLLDSGTLSFFSGKLREKFEPNKNAFIINIDHHEVNTGFAKLTYVDNSQPSLCSVLIDMFRELNIKFDSELANRLLIGVCTDSGFFTYDSNPGKALRDVSFLIENGADYLENALKPILYSQPLKLKRYFAFLVDNLKINNKLKFGYSCISATKIKEFDLNIAEVRLGINELQFINELDFVFTLAELEGHIKGSFRSKKGVDVSIFAKALGGGGHKPAASFSFAGTSMAEAEQKTIEVIEKLGKTYFRT